MKTLVLGVGNTMLGDDAVGVRCVHEIASSGLPGDIAFKDCAAAGLNLLDEILDYDRLILVDAVLTDEIGLGQVSLVQLNDLHETSESIALHSCGLPALIELARRLYGARVPSRITVFGLGIRAVDTVSESLTPQTRAALPQLVRLVRDELCQTA